MSEREITLRFSCQNILQISIWNNQKNPKKVEKAQHSNFSKILIWFTLKLVFTRENNWNKTEEQCIQVKSNNRNEINCSVYLVYIKGNGTPLQYSCLENPMDGGAW